jgi:hypothetical protein
MDTTSVLRELASRGKSAIARDCSQALEDCKGDVEALGYRLLELDDKYPLAGFRREGNKLLCDAKNRELKDRKNERHEQPTTDNIPF